MQDPRRHVWNGGSKVIIATRPTTLIPMQGPCQAMRTERTKTHRAYVPVEKPNM